jgi:peptide/nickel transport system ATP-binding protein
VTDNKDILLEIRNLQTCFYTDNGVSRAVDGVSFSIKKGKTLGLVGESGCGKSVTALSIMRLIPDPPGKIIAGSVIFGEKDLLRIPEKEMRKMRGNRISMIFQEPMTSLNPVFTVGEQVAEVFRIHKNLSRRDAWNKAVDMLDMVRISDAKKRAKQYPHEMSGGMRQRIMIAIALSCQPDFLIADEPTTALDVTVQAQILLLMDEMKARFNSAILMISHNLGVIASIADEVAVMYAGKIIEQACVKDLFKRPLHPYTTGLLNSVPKLDDINSNIKLQPIMGSVPDPVNYPAGCRFNPRCSKATDKCRREMPDLKAVDDEGKHRVRCFLWEK